MATGYKFAGSTAGSYTLTDRQKRDRRIFRR